MISKKIAVFVVLSSLIFYEFNELKVPETIEEPFNYRINKGILKAVFYMSHVAASFSYGTEPANIRDSLAFLSSLGRKLHPNVTSTNTQIEGVDVRIYKTLNSSESKTLPILIFFHGGGFAMGSLDFYEEYLSKITYETNVVTISVHYRKAPEYPYPIPTDDSYLLAKYVLDSGNEFGDTDRIILAGDSAGGNIVAVIAQRLNSEQKKMPKLQVLIYPWTQMFDNKLPSCLKYPDNLAIKGKFIGWYIGIENIDQDVREIILNNSHTLLIKDQKLKQKLKSYTDISLIPSEYKSGKSYYNTYELHREEMIPETIDESSILFTNKTLANLLSKVYMPEISPGLAEPEKLKGLPKTLFISCEIDPIKDQGLIYSQRLKNAGVSVDVHFYESCYHGCVSVVSKNSGLNVSRLMMKNLINYINIHI